MAGEAARLYISVGANTAPAARGLMSLDGSLKKTAASAAKMIGVIGGIAAVSKGIQKAAQVTIEFDKNMRNVNSIAHLNERQFQKLSTSVRKLGAETAQSPRKLAEGLYDLVSSGFDANESLLILKSSAKAATAGLTDTATSTKAVAAVLNAYHRPAKDAAKVSDDLFQTVNRGVLSFGDLASNIGDVLPFAAALHVGLKQVGAATATMTKAGVSAPETMTRIKSVMSTMIKPSEDLQKSYKKLGVTSGEELVKKTGSLQGAVVALSDSVGGNKTALSKLFPDIRALGGALLLTGDNAKGAKDDLKAFANDSGITNKTLAEQSKSVSYQWNKLKAQAESITIGLGSKLVPAASKAMGAISGFVQEIQTGKGSGGDFGDAFSSSMDKIKASVSDNMPQIKATFDDMKDIGKTITGAISGIHFDLGGLFDGMFSGAVQRIHGTIATIKAALHGDLKGMMAGVGDTMAGTARMMTAPFEAVAKTLPAPFKSAISTILGLFSSLLSAASTVVGQMAKIPGIGGAFKGMADGIKAAAGEIDGLRDRITAVPKKIVIDANAEKAKSILKSVEGTKLGTKVMKVLGDKKDADSKIKALIALGIPEKKAKVLAEVADALAGISSVSAALAAIPLRKSVSIEIQQHGTTNFPSLTNGPNGTGGSSNGSGSKPAAPTGGPKGHGSATKGMSSTAEAIAGMSWSGTGALGKSALGAAPVARASAAKPPKKVIGNNPTTGKIEYHTPDEWRKIRAKATEKKKAKKNAPSITTTMEPGNGDADRVGLPKGENRFDGSGGIGSGVSFTAGITSLAQQWSDRANEAMAGVAQAALTKGNLGDDQFAASRLVDVRTQEYGLAVQGGNAQAITEAAQNLQAASDQLDQASEAIKQAAETARDAVFTADDAAGIMAKVNTPDDTSDDLAAQTKSLADATRFYNEAVAAGDNAGIIKWGGAILSLRDEIKNNTEAISENTQAILDLTKQQLDAANRTVNTGQGELSALLTYIRGTGNGQIGGWRRPATAQR